MEIKKKVQLLLLSGMMAAVVGAPIAVIELQAGESHEEYEDLGDIEDLDAMMDEMIDCGAVSDELPTDLVPQWQLFFIRIADKMLATGGYISEKSGVCKEFMVNLFSRIKDSLFGSRFGSRERSLLLNKIKNTYRQKEQYDRNKA